MSLRSQQQLLARLRTSSRFTASPGLSSLQPRSSSTRACRSAATVSSLLSPARCFEKQHHRLQQQFRVLRTHACSVRLVACSRSAAVTAVTPPPLPVVASLTHRRSHGHGHGHGGHHHHDTTYLTSANTSDAGVRITRIGLAVNLAMAVGKGLGGYVFHSQALVADAIHSLTDLVSDFMTLATVSLSLRPPSDRFPTGFGKVESLGSLGVSGLLLVGGVLMGWNACDVLYTQLFLDAAEQAGHAHGHGHSHSHTDLGPNINAIWILGASIAIKEYLYRATMKIALERKSSVLASNAVHHRVDSLSSIVALVAIAGSKLIQDAAWLDPVGGLLVSLMVIRAGWSNTGAALLELADSAIDPDVKDAVRAAAAAAAAGAGTGQDEVRVKDVQGIKSGQNYLVELQLAVPGDWSVAKTQPIEARVRERVGVSVRGVRRVKVHFVPLEEASADFADEFIGAQTAPAGPLEGVSGPANGKKQH